MVSNRGLNFPRLLNGITSSSNQELSLLVGSALFCEYIFSFLLLLTIYSRHNLKRKIVRDLVCSCSSHEPENVCFVAKENLTETKIAVVCGGRPSNVSVHSFFSSHHLTSTGCSPHSPSFSKFSTSRCLLHSFNFKSPYSSLCTKTFRKFPFSKFFLLFFFFFLKNF